MNLRFDSLVAVLRHRAAAQPDHPAYAFQPDRGGPAQTLSFAALLARAERIAVRLAERGNAGDRALLMLPQGLDFMAGFFGCLLAGIVGVPIRVPRRHGGRDAAATIIADCTPRLALTTRDVMVGARADLAEKFAGSGLEWVTVDADLPEAATPVELVPSRGDLAFLQYTSGSTAAPKGVMVSHGNLLANLEMMREVFGGTLASTCVSWVPLYHDMGLIMNALHSAYVGARCVLLSPVAFAQRPLGWLRAIHDWRAEIAGGPNFAFDLCVERYRAEQMTDLDLSCWQVAFNGAEPVRAETIERFAATFARHGFARAAMQPAYGLAEATVLVSCGRRGSGPRTRMVSRRALQQGRIASPDNPGDARTVVGCGRALVGERTAIVDPVTRQPLPPRHIGEIWVGGPHVAGGYWQRADMTAETFRAHLAGEDDADWLRTGDLGFLDAAGELFVTGRIKDIVIVRGVNHYPQDLEYTAQQADPALRRHGAAAFGIDDQRGGERLVIVQEIERSERRRIAPDELVGRIREAIAAEHEIAVHAVALIPPGALPRTTSGKVQRALARKLWLEGAFDRLTGDQP